MNNGGPGDQFYFKSEGPFVEGSLAPSKQIDGSVEDLQHGRYRVIFPMPGIGLQLYSKRSAGAQKQTPFILSSQILILGFLLFVTKNPQGNF